MINGRAQIVILGGGIGGIAVATKLGRLLGAKHDVILVDRRDEHIFTPSFLFLMVGQRRPEDLKKRLKLLEKRRVKVVQSEILDINPLKQHVVLDNSTIPYDYLVVSLGLQTVPELIPGFNEGAHHAWEMDAALKVQKALQQFNEGRILVGIPLGPYRCPPAPYETQWMLDSFFRRAGRRERVEIEYFTRDPEPSGEAHDPVVWMDAQSKSRNIKQNYEFVVNSIDPEKKTVLGLYGYKLTYDLLFLIPPHRPAQVLRDCGLADSENGIRVDYDTLESKWDNVYAIGDCADLPASKAGMVAHQEADIVSHNLAVEITGRGEPTTLGLHTI